MDAYILPKGGNLWMPIFYPRELVDAYILPKETCGCLYSTQGNLWMPKLDVTKSWMLISAQKKKEKVIYLGLFTQNNLFLVVRLSVCVCKRE